MLALLLCMAAVSVNLGAMEISPADVVRIIAARITGNDTILGDIGKNAAAVVWSIRLPRIICGIFVGSGLAVAGVIFQGILQNPLADPYTLGISTGASFGASLAIYLAFLLDTSIPVVPFALVFAFATLISVICISKKGSGLESSNLIIGGIIVSSILSSGVSFIKMLAGENVGAIVFWLMGSLDARGWNDAALAAVCVTVLTVPSVIFARELDIMSTGDESARSLGINTSRLRLVYLIIGASITAVCVSVCGIIGFVGLIVPHLLRMWLTSENRVLIPLSALTGGILLCAADNITRVAASGEVPVGVITTLIGGPFFIYIFTRRKK